MSKPIAIQLPDGQGGTRLADVELEPTTTARDIVAALQLGSNFVLAPLNDPTRVFALDEAIYGQVSEGEKLIASVPASVGAEQPLKEERALQPSPHNA